MRHLLARAFRIAARRAVHRRFASLSLTRVGSFCLAFAAAIFAPLTRIHADDGPAAVERRPVHHKVDVLVSSAELDDWRYLAFPALLDLGDEVLVSYKRGRAHAADTGAGLELVRLDPAAGRVCGRQTLAQLDNHIMQMGEWVRFPNGDIANFIDAQGKETATARAGLHPPRGRVSGQHSRL